tara:strand:- start:188 stop:370 length:183 start_codon:yes stop_codon:yes gene_type:complete
MVRLEKVVVVVQPKAQVEKVVAKRLGHQLRVVVKEMLPNKKVCKMLPNHNQNQKPHDKTG